MLKGYAIVFKSPKGWSWRHPDRTLHESFASSEEASLDARKQEPRLTVKVVKPEDGFKCAGFKRVSSARQTFNHSVREHTSMRLSF